MTPEDGVTSYCRTFIWIELTKEGEGNAMHRVSTSLPVDSRFCSGENLVVFDK